jgi:hypothetical protein
MIETTPPSLLATKLDGYAREEKEVIEKVATNAEE